MNEKFVFDDGWLLISIWGAGSPCDLDKLRITSDVFNHAVISDSEIEDGIRRLSVAGMAFRGEDGSFSITEKGKKYIDDRWRPKEGHIVQFFRIARELEGTWAL
jgi:hypothetical protein